MASQVSLDTTRRLKPYEYNQKDKLILNIQLCNFNTFNPDSWHYGIMGLPFGGGHMSEKNLGGRPFLSAADNRSHRVMIRYSPNEMAIMDEARRLSGIRVCTMIREESLRYCVEFIKACKEGKAQFPF